MRREQLIFVAVMCCLFLLAGCGIGGLDDPSLADRLSGSDDFGMWSDESTAGSGLDSPSRGIWENDIYHNAFAGLTFKLPENWGIGSDEEIAALMGVGVELLSEGSSDNYAQKILELKTIYDMMAANLYTHASVSVMFENLLLTIGGTSLTEDKYLDILNGLLSEHVTGDYEDAFIGSEIYRMMPVYAEYFATGIEQYYFVRREGNYMIALIVSLTEEDDIDSVMANFI